MERKKISKNETINFIRSILSAGEGIVALSEFLSNFKKETGCSMPLFGHETIVDFLKSMPNMVQVFEIERTFYLQLVEDETSEPLGTDHDLLVESEKEVNEVYVVTPPKSNAEAKLFGNVASKKGNFGKKNKNTPSHVDLVFPSCSKEEDGKCEKPGEEKENDEKEVMCDRCESLKDELEYEACIDRCLSSIALDESDIPVINLKDHVDISDYVGVRVPEVRNPHKFILQLRKYKTELIKLMGRMQIFYSLYGAKYAVENFKFDKDQVCAVLYRTNPEHREWYRAKILNFGTHSSRVLLFDYGVTTEVCNRELKYLDRDFGSLPVQALNGHLANIKPYKGKYWSHDCCKRFYNLVFEEDLVAQVVNMNPAKRWLSVILMYTEEESFRINDNLVRGTFPHADCDFSEDELLSPVIYDSIYKREFLLPEELGRTRRLKSKFKDVEEPESKKSIPYEHRNEELKKLFGLEVSDDESASSSSSSSSSSSRAD